MIKTVLTLFRGSVAAAGEELEDRTALLILDQQMRDAAAAVDRSKRALALAIASDQQEGRRLETTNTRIADLEVRATAALEGGRDDLAREAAQAIANLEAERDAAMVGMPARQGRTVLHDIAGGPQDTPLIELSRYVVVGAEDVEIAA